MIRQHVAMAASLLLLAGCGGTDTVPEDNQGGGAEGELLEGSISDAMIQFDQIRSQSPRAAPEPEEGGATPAAEATAAAEDDASGEAPAADDEQGGDTVDDENSTTE